MQEYVNEDKIARERDREWGNERTRFPTKTVSLISTCITGTNGTSHPPLSSPPPAHFRTPIANHRGSDALIDTNARRIAHPSDERARQNYDRILKRNVRVSPSRSHFLSFCSSLFPFIFLSLSLSPFFYASAVISIVDAAVLAA